MLVFIGMIYGQYILISYLHLLVLQEMIIDKVNGQPVPRYLIYDIIKFSVSAFSNNNKNTLLFALYLIKNYFWH